ncbi:MAG: type II secretion system F family protein [Patescibacteria group bacterium]
MPKFNYKAKEKTGKPVVGVVEAPSLEVAQKLLKDKELIVLDVTEKKGFVLIEKINQALRRVSGRDIVLFSRQLSVLIASTVPLVRSLRILTKQTENKFFKDVISEIASDIDGGMKLSESMGHYPKIFDQFFVHLVRAGETTGRLDEVLEYLADQKEKDYILFLRLRNALIYPAFIITALIGVGLVSLIYVIPKLTAILIESGVDLPVTTRMLIASSNFMKDCWYLVLIFIITFSAVYYFIRNLEGFRYQIDLLKLRLPVVGKIFQKIYLARFSRSFANLLASGVPITKALEICADIVNNKVYSRLLKKTAREVENGTPIFQVIEKSPYVPAMLAHMINIGEETGRLDQILQKIADFFATEVENGVQTMVNLIEPAIIMLLGIATGFLVISILMPMYDLTEAIG